MTKKTLTKNQFPIRFRAARIESTIGSITSTIENKLKLPEGSVRLVLPNGRKAHADGKV